MRDEQCVGFLQWVLPQLHMRWPGFRKVRKQVCKRLQRRINALELADVAAYRSYLQSHADEWAMLDFLCRVTVSRFYRDRGVLERLRSDVLPELARAAIAAGDTALCCWSAGCAMGEEAYTLLLIWDRTVGKDYPRLDINVVGSDIDDVLLQRARRACYAYGSIKALPVAWRMTAFDQRGDEYCLTARLRDKARFIKQDIRDQLTKDRFHIVFCRNMAFTYFDEPLQREMLAHIRTCLVDGGALVTGGHESLPEGFRGFEQWPGQQAIFRKTEPGRWTLNDER